MEKGNFRGVGIRNSIPIFQAFDQLLRAWVLWLRRFDGGGQLIGEEDVGIAVSVGLHFQHVFGAQIVPVVEKIVYASGAKWLVPSVGQVRFVIWPHHTRIGCDYQSGFRIERLRELVKGDVAGPLIVIGVPGNRHFTVALLSKRNSRGHDVSDVAVNVGVDRVLPRAPYALQGFTKFFPVSCFAKPGIAVGEPAWFGGGPAQGVGLVALTNHDRAVAGHGDFEVFIRLSLDANRFVKDLRLCPGAFYAVLIGEGWIESLDVEVLNVCTIVGEAPGDAVVMTDDNHRRPRQRKAFDVPAGCREVNFVPDWRNPEIEMGVIGQQRLASGSMRATHNPMVAAKALANLVRQFPEKLVDGL